MVMENRVGWGAPLEMGLGSLRGGCCYGYLRRCTAGAGETVVSGKLALGSKHGQMGRENSWVEDARSGRTLALILVDYEQNVMPWKLYTWSG